jgi:hypothetical protein
MKRSLTSGFVAMVVLLVLVACGISVGPAEPPTADRSVQTRSGLGPAQATLTMAPNETKLIRVSIPSDQRSSARRLVVEADDDDGRRQLDMVLFSGNGVTPIASTSGTAFFRPGLQGIGDGFIGTAKGVEQLQGGIGGVCLGPCISHATHASVYFVELRNRTTSTVSVPFYAFTEPWQTPNEPHNDGPAGAVSVPPRGDFFRGVIERVGDVDYVRFPQAGRVAFDRRANYDTQLELRLYSVTGAYIQTVRPGDDAFDVFPNEYARIGSVGQRASVYGFYDVYYD